MKTSTASGAKPSPLAILSLPLLFVLTASVPVLAQVTAAPPGGVGGMVCGPEPLAIAVGRQVLAEGGNAVDAAVATGFALAVTLPRAGNLGGGGFLVLHLGEGKAITIDHREMAPASAHRGSYLDEDGEPRPGESTIGHRAAGVPGTVAGLCHAAQQYGTWPLARLMAPAIRLAEEGFPVSRFLARSLAGSAGKLRRFDESRRIYLGKEGRGRREGEIFRQPDLARTLRLIAEQGSQGFYEGPTAERIVAEMKRGKGWITAEDLAGYRVVEREPLRGRYRGHEVLSMPPPSSGGVALIQMLNLLEPYPVGAWGFGSERTLHHMVESMRLAFRDRARWLGDPDFAEVPTEKLIARSYADTLRKRIAAHASASEGMAKGPLESDQTTHVSVVDADGRAVAYTTTLNGSYGSGVTVRGAGFLLNNEMDDFATVPGRPNMYGLVQAEANVVEAGKRPLSSMTPTILLKDGEVVLVAGSPGGPRIINVVLQCVLNVVDHGMNAAEAVTAPRIHHQWLPDELITERFAINPDVRRALEARGHRFATRTPKVGAASIIVRDPATGRVYGGADPRYGGAAAWAPRSGR